MVLLAYGRCHGLPQHQQYRATDLRGQITRQSWPQHLENCPLRGLAVGRLFATPFLQLWSRLVVLGVCFGRVGWVRKVAGQSARLNQATVPYPTITASSAPTGVRASTQRFYAYPPG